MSTVPFTVSVTVTLADQVEFNTGYVLSRPRIRVPRIILSVVALGIWPFVWLLGFVLSYTHNAARLPFAAAFWEQVRTTPPFMFVVAVLVVAVVGIGRLSHRPFLVWRLRRVLKDRPGVDPRDPALQERKTMTFTGAGYTVEEPGRVQEVKWQAVRGLVETRSLLVPMTGRLAGTIVPKRDLSGEHEAALRALVAERAGRPDQVDAGC